MFAIRLAGELVGTTSFFDFNATLPAAEIGSTWLDARQHGSGLNTSMKVVAAVSMADTPTPISTSLSGDVPCFQARP